LFTDNQFKQKSFTVRIKSKVFSTVLKKEIIGTYFASLKDGGVFP